MGLLRRKAFSKALLAKRRVTQTLLNVRVQEVHLRTQSLQPQKPFGFLSQPLEVQVQKTALALIPNGQIESLYHLNIVPWDQLHDSSGSIPTSCYSANRSMPRRQIFCTAKQCDTCIVIDPYAHLFPTRLCKILESQCEIRNLYCQQFRRVLEGTGGGKLLGQVCRNYGCWFPASSGPVPSQPHNE